jgi:hypothetical protein
MLTQRYSFRIASGITSNIVTRRLGAFVSVNGMSEAVGTLRGRRAELGCVITHSSLDVIPRRLSLGILG